MRPRSGVLHESSLPAMRALAPTVAVLPWGATEAHGQHLPHGCDTLQAQYLAEEAVQAANSAGAKAVALPSIPFGNNAQHLDQVATIHLQTTTARAILWDVANSLLTQNIDKLVILNPHGGNEFRPLIRDLLAEKPIFCVLADVPKMAPALSRELFDQPGDHAGALETSMMMELTPDWVDLSCAGEGARLPFQTPSLNTPGVWTPRPWSRIHPDAGSGNPLGASAEAGEKYLKHVVTDLTQLLIDLSSKRTEELP